MHVYIVIESKINYQSVATQTSKHAQAHTV